MPLRHAYSATNRYSASGANTTWSDGTTSNVSFLSDGHMDRQFVTTGVASGINVIIDLGASYAVNAVAVLNSNVAVIGGTVTLKVEYADNVGFTVGVTTAKAATTLNLTNPKHKDHVLQFASATKRYWRLTWTWTGTQILKVGEIFIGATTQLSRAIVYGDVTRYSIRRSFFESYTGETRGHYIAGPIRSRELPFEDLSDAEAEELRAMWAASYGGANSMLWCESYEATATAAANAEQDCIFGRLEESDLGLTAFDFGRANPSGLTLRSRGREVGA